jgi:hypothetical protein
MKRLIATSILAAFALPVIADEVQSPTPRLSQLETIVVTANKEEPATSRLQDYEIVVITAPKEAPEEYRVSDKTAALLAEIEKEEK